MTDPIPVDPTPVPDPPPAPTPAELDQAVIDASLNLTNVLLDSPTDTAAIEAATQQVMDARQARGYE